MREQSIAIKGVKDGLLVSISEGEDWSAVIADLASRIDTQSAFFAGARITLDVGARPVRKDELGSIKAMLERRSINLYAVQSESYTSIDAAAALDLRAHYTGSTTRTAWVTEDSAGYHSEEEGTTGILIRRTLRSGRTVSSPGHVVVLGDVNAGASIVAGGDVIVWGRLRGTIHAGAYGDETAVVCALDMAPTQLRIADYISVSPVDKRHKPLPERALIVEGGIVVEPWLDARD
jgi:septum site-determining protein MinC